MKLLVDEVASYQEVIPCKGTRGKAGVTRQDDAALVESEAQDLVILVRGVIKYVDPEQPHPLRKFSQHYIGDELHEPSHPPRRHRDTEKTEPQEGRREEVFFSNPHIRHGGTKTRRKQNHGKEKEKKYFSLSLCTEVYENLFNLSELEITLTELKAMAADAYIGFNSPFAPRNGYRTPAAMGMPITL